MTTWEDKRCWAQPLQILCSNLFDISLGKWKREGVCSSCAKTYTVRTVCNVWHNRPRYDTLTALRAATSARALSSTSSAGIKVLSPAQEKQSRHPQQSDWQGSTHSQVRLWWPFLKRERERGGGGVSIISNCLLEIFKMKQVAQLHMHCMSTGEEEVTIRHQTFDAGRKRPKLEKMRKENARVGLSVANSGIGKLHLKFDREAERVWTTAVYLLTTPTAK